VLPTSYGSSRRLVERASISAVARRIGVAPNLLYRWHGGGHIYLKSAARPTLSSRRRVPIVPDHA
jgi:hypothetical protein